MATGWSFNTAKTAETIYLKFSIHFNICNYFVSKLPAVNLCNALGDEADGVLISPVTLFYIMKLT
jgi:hypothetical protein